MQKCCKSQKEKSLGFSEGGFWPVVQQGLQNGVCKHVSFYNTTASTWTFATRRTTWEWCVRHDSHTTSVAQYMQGCTYISFVYWVDSYICSYIQVVHVQRRNMHFMYGWQTILRDWSSSDNKHRLETSNSNKPKRWGVLRLRLTQNSVCFQFSELYTNIPGPVPRNEVPVYVLGKPYCRHIGR